MFLEILTLLALALAVLAKYTTARHMSALNRERLELENACQYHERLYKRIFRERENGEVEEKGLDQQADTLEANLKALEKELEEQNERNQELES